MKQNLESKIIMSEKESNKIEEFKSTIIGYLNLKPESWSWDDWFKSTLFS